MKWLSEYHTFRGGASLYLDSIFYQYSSTSLRLIPVRSVNSNSPSSSPGRQEITDTKSPTFVFSMNSGPSTPAFSKLGCDFAAEEVNFRSWKTDTCIVSSFNLCVFVCLCYRHRHLPSQAPISATRYFWRNTDVCN